MRQLYKSDFQPDEIYIPGSICKFPDGAFRVLSYDREWVFAAAKPDDSDRGPAGQDGKNGRDGESVIGPAGRDGQSIELAGRYRAGREYTLGQVVSFEGSSFVCREATRTAPSKTSRCWQLLAARGAKGENGRNGVRQVVTREKVIEGASVTAVFDSDTPKGAVIYISGDGHVDLAQANNGATFTAVGIAIQDVVAGQPGQYIPVGPVSCETWSLTPGSVYYLDPFTAGGLTAVYPETSGHFVVIVGTAATTTQLNLRIHWFAEQ